MKLRSRGFGNSDIEAVIRECRRMDYLNDVRFAAAYLQQLQRKGYGINRIRHKLYTKGIVKTVIQESVEPYRRDEIQLDNCRNVLAKKLKTCAGQNTKDNLRPKLQRFLFNRGFPNHIIRQAVDDAFFQKD